MLLLPVQFSNVVSWYAVNARPTGNKRAFWGYHVLYVLHYISGFVASKLAKCINCPACIEELTAPKPVQERSDHDYCQCTTNDTYGKAASFTLFANNGGLCIPSASVIKMVSYAKSLFKLLCFQRKSWFHHQEEEPESNNGHRS